MRSLQGRMRRNALLKVRIASPADNHFARCTIFGCGKPTQRAAKVGLAIALCPKHLACRQRHGSPWCRSPAASALRPYVTAALRFTQNNRHEPYVASALGGLQGLMDRAGPVIIATRLRGLPAGKRAMVALARLREAGVKPERLLAIAVAVHALFEEAPQVVHRIKEFRVVAIAKAAHRLSSGYHRVWETISDDGRIFRSELHAYPRSSGQVLRHLGVMIEEECGWVIERHLASILEAKIARYGSYPASSL